MKVTPKPTFKLTRGFRCRDGGGRWLVSRADSLENRVCRASALYSCAGAGESFQGVHLTPSNFLQSVGNIFCILKSEPLPAAAITFSFLPVKTFSLKRTRTVTTKIVNSKPLKKKIFVYLMFGFSDVCLCVWSILRKIGGHEENAGVPPLTNKQVLSLEYAHIIRGLTPTGRHESQE